jgi:hypothetical protein
MSSGRRSAQGARDDREAQPRGRERCRVRCRARGEAPRRRARSDARDRRARYSICRDGSAGDREAPRGIRPRGANRGGQRDGKAGDAKAHHCGQEARALRALSAADRPDRHFVRRGELDDTFALAEIVAEDEHEFVQTVTGGMLREAGNQDRARLLAFLDENAARMPRRALRDAVESSILTSAPTIGASGATRSSRSASS